MSEWRENLAVETAGVIADREQSDAATLAAERAARGAAWLAEQGYAPASLGPSWDVDVRHPQRCPLGRTIGYTEGKDRAVPNVGFSGWDAWYNAQIAWAAAHGFRTSDTFGDPVRYDDLNDAWRDLIDRAREAAGTAE